MSAAERDWPAAIVRCAAALERLAERDGDIDDRQWDALRAERDDLRNKLLRIDDVLATIGMANAMAIARIRAILRGEP